MSTIIKSLVSVTAMLVFIYAANLAMQGNLEAEFVQHDLVAIRSYICEQTSSLKSRYF